MPSWSLVIAEKAASHFIRPQPNRPQRSIQSDSWSECVANAQRENHKRLTKRHDPFPDTGPLWDILLHTSSRNRWNGAGPHVLVDCLPKSDAIWDFRFGLKALGQTVKDICGLVYPASLPAGAVVDFAQRFPETQGAVTNRQLWSGGQASGFQI